MPKRLTTDEFVKKAKQIYGDKYDYSKVEYVNIDTKVCIICLEHGEFWQTPLNHLNRNGCPICVNKKKLTTEEFVHKAKKIHGDRYDYSKVDYKNNKTKVCIICPKHGEFWQQPDKHLCNNGCPKCKMSKLEMRIAQLLAQNNITFACQKTFSWLRYKQNLLLDFYLPEYNLAIECQGVQHFKSAEYFGGDKQLKLNQHRDLLKKQLCKEHEIQILYFSDVKYTEEIIIEEKELLSKIKVHERKSV